MRRSDSGAGGVRRGPPVADPPHLPGPRDGGLPPAGLPPEVATSGLARWDSIEELRRLVADGNPLAHHVPAPFLHTGPLDPSVLVVVPHWAATAVPRVVIVANRVERRMAALRVIEALRLHAAAHEGRLPDRLAEVREVPVPNGPHVQIETRHYLIGLIQTLQKGELAGERELPVKGRDDQEYEEGSSPAHVHTAYMQ